MTDTEIQAKVMEIISDNLGDAKPKIEMNSNIKNDLGIDLSTLAKAFEKAFDIEILDDDYGDMETVEYTIDYIKGKMMIYAVIKNKTGELSIYPDMREAPLEWEKEGFKGTREECIDYMREKMAAMSPEELRRTRMG